MSRPQPARFTEVLEELAERMPASRTAVSCGDAAVSFGELNERADRLAGSWQARGVEPGAVVALALYNSVAYAECVLAAFKLGAVVANVNYRYVVAELSYVLNHIDARAFVCDSSIADKATEAAGATGVELVVHTGTAELAGADRYEDLIANGQPPARTSRDAERALYVLTGGTTGHPKAVVWEHGELMEIISSIFPLLGVPRPRSWEEHLSLVDTLSAEGTAPVMLTLAPLIHGTGLFNALRTLLVGGSVAFCASHVLDPREAWTTVERRGVTDLAIVGDAFGSRLLAELRTAGDQGRQYDLRSLRRISSAGVAWSPPVKRGLLEYADVALIDLISASEGGPFGMSVVSRNVEVERARFQLAPTARVLDADDRDVRPGSGEVGTLASTGAQAVGYLNDPARTNDVWREIGGVRHCIPGDLAAVSADGSLEFIGRGESVINTGGEKVFPEEVEAALTDCPGITDAVVVGLPDPVWGNAVTALVSTRTGSDADRDTVTAHLRDRLARYKFPRSIVTVPEIMRSPAGKANRAWAVRTATERLDPPATTNATTNPGVSSQIQDSGSLSS